jgi:hypothetical protein
MNSRVFVVCLLSAAMGMITLHAEEPASGPNTEALKLNSMLKKALEIQRRVYDDTKALQKTIEARADGKANADDEQASLKLAAKIKELVAESTTVIDAMKDQKLKEVVSIFSKELFDNMNRVQSRLEKTDLGADTQATENQIIEKLVFLNLALRPL